MKRGDWWYNLCKKYKVIDWIDDYIVWYIYNKPKDWYKSVKHWIYCNFNKEHFNLVKTAFFSYPWDSYYLDKLNKCQIEKMIKYFEVHNEFENSDTNVLRPLKIAKHCLDVKLDDDILSKYDETKPLHERFEYIGPKLNYKNIYRFIDCSSFTNIDHIEKSEFYNNIISFYEKNPEEYYKLKAENIYYKILKQYADRWWY